MRADTDDDPVPRLAAVAALAAVIAWVLWQRWQLALSSPYPHGVDGYFYAAQLQSLVDSHELRWPAAPLTFWLLWPLAAIAGPVWAVKIGGAALASLVAAPIHGVARELGAPRAVALAAATLAATSPAVFYFGVEFVKNGAGMTAAATAIWAALIAARRRDRVAIAGAAAALLAAWLTHKSAALIAAVAIAPLAFRAVGRRSFAIAAAIALAVVAAIGLIAPRRFVGAGDLALAGELFSGSADFGLPVQRLGDRVLLFGREVWLAAGAALAYAALWATGRLSETQRAVAGLAILALVAAIPWIDASDPGGPGFRLRLAVFLPLSITAAVVATVAARRSPRAITAGALALAGFVAAFRPAVYPPPIVEQHPALVAAVAAAADHVPDGDAVVTPERRLVFAYSFLTGGRATRDPGAVAADHRWRMIPLTYASPGLLDAIERARKEAPAGVDRPISLHPYARDGLLLMREAFWREALGLLPVTEREHYQRWPTY